MAWRKPISGWKIVWNGKDDRRVEGRNRLVEAIAGEKVVWGSGNSSLSQ
jgi:hypothetical protein